MGESRPAFNCRSAMSIAVKEGPAGGIVLLLVRGDFVLVTDFSGFRLLFGRAPSEGLFS